MIAIGIGCRRGIAKEAFVEMIRQALSLIGDAAGVVELFTIEDKHDEAGLLAAAADLRLPIRFLSRAALQSVEASVVTPSPQAETAFGVASVSEAAALAGAGCGAVLIVPRIVGQGVTCAVARGGGR
ncbi:MAG TPA: cobalamin biosynthesis protein [Methylovirgula sp.]